MANKDDYLTCYREFFENFAQTVNPNDQLPVKLASYKLINKEVIGGVIDWTTQYLTQKKCPQSLIAPLIQIVIEETRKSCKKQPTACGFNPSDNAYEPLKLMQTVMAKTNEICLRYLDNSMLCSLPAPNFTDNIISVGASRNKRRKMEDRHVVIHDLNTMFNVQEATPSSYYAIFDGHAGHDAAAYSAAHLHQFLAENKFFISDPTQALQAAFSKTDFLFIEKCKVEKFNSGTTAVCALLRPKEKKLYIAWVGDSQALLVNKGCILQCVDPHKPGRQDEKERIEKAGGYVCYWGTWRVNGQLAVSRAIGDSEYKPYVTAVPDIREVPLDGGEDFLILGCDGLWDFVTEDEVALAVYQMVRNHPDKVDRISEQLVQLSKDHGSSDNISVIVVFLRDPSKIAADAPPYWANRNNMEAGLDNANNLSMIKSNGSDFKHNGQDYKLPAFFASSEKANGKRLASEFEDEGEFGPETNVDTADDLLSSPSFIAAKALADGFGNNNPDCGNLNPFYDKCEEVEKAALELDLDLQKQQSREFDGERSPREETPTPPADTVNDGGLEDHIGDSGEESEDEWNYIKGEEANKENLNPLQSNEEEAGINLEENEVDMSQLNPNAAEFVPVSPTRSIPSPACRALLNEQVLAESPKRATEIDINLPNQQDFEKEVKSRPSDFDLLNNGHDAESDQRTVDLMENLLNGKNIDEIPEFQPGNSPTKSTSATVEEFHFGPNAAPFTPAKIVDQSSEISTTAVYGDEEIQVVSDCTLDNILSKDHVDFIEKSKEDDPMSMSFYQNEEDDLNKVRRLPDNLDEFLSSTENNTSDELQLSTENKENEPTDTNTRNISIELFGDKQLITTDLDKFVVEEKELASPIASNEDDEEEESGVCELAKSPQADELVCPVVCSLPKDRIPIIEAEVETEEKEIEKDLFVCSFKPLEIKTEEQNIRAATPESVIATSPKAELDEREEIEELSSISPEPLATTISSKAQINVDVTDPEFIICESAFTTHELVTSESNLVNASEQQEFVLSTPAPGLVDEAVDLLEVVANPSQPLVDTLETKDEILRSDFDTDLEAPVLSSESLTEPEKVLTPEPEVEKDQLVQPSRNETVILEDTSQLMPVNVENVCEPPTSPLPSSVESQIDEVTSSVKDAASPIASPIPDQPTDVTSLVELNFAHEINDAIEEAISQPVEQSSPIKDELLLPEVGLGSTPKSEITDAESVTTADVNSFLERSPISSLASPLSPGDQPTCNNEVMDLNHPLMKCVYPLPRMEPILDETKSEIKTEQLCEIAEPVLLPSTQPTEEIKQEEALPALSEQNKKVLEKGAGEGQVSKTTKATATKGKTVTPTPTKRTSTGLKSTAKPAAAGAKPRSSTSSASPKTAARPASSSTGKASNLGKPTTTKPTTAKSTLEKKPITNGEVKRTSTTKLISSTLSKSATSPSKAKVTSTTRPISSPIKPTTASSTTAKTKPQTTSTLKPTATKTSMTRPTTLGKVSTTNSAATKAATTGVAKTTLSPRSAAAPTKPRVPLSARPAATKSVEAEKQNKDSANKITASKNVASARTLANGTSRTATSSANPVKKADSAKIGAARTNVTKTTTTTSARLGATKKLSSTSTVSRTTTTKTTTTKIEKPIQNGVTTVVTEKIIMNNGSSDMIKDPSPLDNKLVMDNDTTTITGAD